MEGRTFRVRVFRGVVRRFVPSQRAFIIRKSPMFPTPTWCSRESRGWGWQKRRTQDVIGNLYGRNPLRQPTTFTTIGLLRGSELPGEGIRSTSRLPIRIQV